MKEKHLTIEDMTPSQIHTIAQERYKKFKSMTPEERLKEARERLQRCKETPLEDMAEYYGVGSEDE